jgi:tRNA-specific 2-thiouridylase
MKSRKAVAMFSGGLDSCLAVYLIKSQGIEVVAVNFQTPFNQPRRKRDMPDLVESMAGQLGVELIRKRLEKDYLEVIRSPRYGYGRALNPCIDCKIFLVKKTAEIMKNMAVDFIITGEVLGQRPMSQRKDILSLIDKQSGYQGIILRPLSAKLIPPTIPEEKGWVDREELLDISGRSRTRQMELAERFGVRGYPSPAGGCLLTEPEYSRKLADLFQHTQDVSGRDIELLNVGRHFRLSDRVKIVVGKNDAENKRILELVKDDELLLVSDDTPGPTTLIQGRASRDEIVLSAEITARYIRKSSSEPVNFRLMKGSEKEILDRIEAQALDTPELESYRI